MRAMEQLPAYVDRVASGGRDVPLALLPLLNDLRAVRGSALLSEGTLLLLNLRSDEPARPAGVDATGQSVVERARKLRPRFQLALLGWIRGEHVQQNLSVLADIAVQFESAASTQPLFQLWWWSDPCSRHCSRVASTAASPSSACSATWTASCAACRNRARAAMRSRRRSSC